MTLEVAREGLGDVGPTVSTARNSTLERQPTSV